MPSQVLTIEVRYRKNWRGWLVDRGFLPLKIRQWISGTGPVGRIKLDNRPWVDSNLSDFDAAVFVLGPEAYRRQNIKFDFTGYWD